MEVSSNRATPISSMSSGIFPYEPSTSNGVALCRACKDAPKLIPLMVLADRQRIVRVLCCTGDFYMFGEYWWVYTLGFYGFKMMIMGLSVKNQWTYMTIVYINADIIIEMV